MGVLGLGEEDHRDKVLFYHIISREHTMNMIMTIDVDLDPLVEIVCVRFLQCKVTLFPPFHFVVFEEEVTLPSPHLRGGKLWSTY